MTPAGVPEPQPFEMRWPVLDPSIPTRELVATAVEDLKHELPLLDLLPLSAPVFGYVTDPTFHRHTGPYLVARLAVRDKVRRPLEPAEPAEPAQPEAVA